MLSWPGSIAAASAASQNVAGVSGHRAVEGAFVVGRVVLVLVLVRVAEV